MTAPAVEERISAPPETGGPKRRRKGRGHLWVGAGLLPVPEEMAAASNRNRGIRLPEETWVIITDTYCERCRGNYEDVRWEDCDPGNPGRRGGPPGGARPNAGLGGGDAPTV